MFWLYFVVGHFVTGLVLVLLACLLTWHLPDREEIRHGLVYGYLNILHVPIYVYLCWSGQYAQEVYELKEDGSIGPVTDGELQVGDGAETPDETGSAPA